MSDQDPGNEMTNAPVLSDAVGQKDLANAIRALTMDAVQQANSGHPGMPMGMADVATVLFSKVLKFDPSAPKWPDRDRFVLSAGHGSMLLYALLYLTGYDDMTLDELKAFRQLGAKTAGHPEFGHASGIETTTGPLGQGISNAVGMALAERMLSARDHAGLVDHFTYAIAGDGCLMEGISHEAASFAGHLQLGRLIVLFDDNGISIDGSTDLACSDDTLSRFRAYGWQTRAIDGHDPTAIEYALLEAKDDPRPSLIACKAVIGFGAPGKQGTAGVHGAPLGPDEIAAARTYLNWPDEPFVIPETILRAWRRIGTRGKAAYAAWQDRFREQTKEPLPVTWRDDLARFKDELITKRPSLATRTSSQEALEVLTKAIPNLIGGSADLTGSNNTKTAVTKSVSAGNFDGRYIHYGVREQAMAAVMNGMALHKGLIPYGGTFLIFSDYARHAIRLSALMGVQVIYVMTHDSIGLGEDGPTHQPIEHLASLRAMPNLHVFRPADAIETAECWAASIEREDGPSLLALTRQSLPTLRLGDGSDNLSALGAYVLAEAKAPRAITLLATGSEVHLAMEAKERLDGFGIAAAVVSLPCFELFEKQSTDYRASVLGSAPRLAIEAASPFGWTRYVEAESDVIGLTGFGASGPAADLYVHFGITPEAIVTKAKAKLGLEEAA